MKAGAYLAELVSFGGEVLPRGEVIRQLQQEGFPQALIDRYLQGLDQSTRGRP